MSRLLKVFLLCPSLLARKLSSSTNSVITSSIISIFETEKVLFAWKSGNIAIESQDRVRRPAGPDITSWSQTMLGTMNVLIETKLEVAYPGIFVVVKDSELFFKKGLFDCVIYGYRAVVSGKPQNITKSKKCIQLLNVIQSVDSNIHGKLSLVEFSTVGPISSSELSAIFLDIGCPVIGTIPGRRMPPMLALVSFSIADHHQLAWAPSNNIIRVETPKKFLKFMTRERLYSDRINSLKIGSMCTESSGGEELSLGSKSHEERDSGRMPFPSITTEFYGLTYHVPSAGLVPRASSSVLVDVALAHLRHIDGGRVMDLGCGGGALLLAVLHSMPAVRGLGVDLDPEALACARLNADNILRERDFFIRDGVHIPRAAFVHGDFGELHELRCNGISSSASRGVDLCDLVEIEEYDVILCNPPFLSEAAARTRVTREAGLALVGGPTGWEAYESVCSSLKRCEEARGPILRPGGLLVFQLPAGATAEQCVTRIVRSHGFTVVETRLDARGIRRCLACTR